MGSKSLAFIRLLLPLVRLKLLGLRRSPPPLPGGVLDEQVDLLQQAQAALDGQGLDQFTPAQARENFRLSLRMLKRTGGLYERVGAVRDLEIPGPAGRIPARLYLPGRDKAYPLLILLHGGGWVIGDLDTADNLARLFCKRLPCAVLSVAYRLAPEHPFPAAVEDAFAAVGWAAEHAAELGGDPARLLVGGDSAGGTLSTVAARLAGQVNGPRLAGQILLYPGADCASLDTPSYREFGDQPLGLTRRDVEWFLSQYVPDPANRRDPRVSPLLAQDLRGLPPAVVVTAEFDVLRDEGEAYARRLAAAGVQVKAIRANGMVHGFLSMVGLIRRAGPYFDQVVAEARRLAA